MSELLDAAVSPANIIVTTLFVFVFIYWITVIIGVLDFDFLDFDVDIDVDAEADGFEVIWLNNALAFFNLHQMPIMIFFTFLIVPAWALMVIVNDFIGNSSFIIGLVILIPVFIVSLFIAKILTLPFMSVFRAMGKSSKSESMIGKICTVTIAVKTDKVGQATIHTGGAPLLLNVLTPQDVEMSSGESGLVIEHIKDRNAYLIEPYNH